MRIATSQLTPYVLAAVGAVGLLVATCGAARGQAVSPEIDPIVPVPVELETTDGVLLKGVFYQADEANKQTPVVVMLPDDGESPAIFDDLALNLQMPVYFDDQVTMSVLAIGLRGQGDSTRVRAADGEITDLRGSRLEKGDAVSMVKLDLEAIRRFLIAKNDAGELNLNRLGYLGVGFGALIATNAAADDWSYPILAQGKQGRDVKAVVLVSPPWKRLGLEMLAPLRAEPFKSQGAVLLTYGAASKPMRDTAVKIMRQVPQDEANDSEEGTANNGDREAPTPRKRYPRVVELPGDSKLQGSDWLKQVGGAGERRIIQFLQGHLVEPNHPWIQRTLD